MIIRKIIREELQNILSKDIICKNCNWEWDIEGDDKNPFLCHRCGYDNDKNVFDLQALKKWKIDNGLIDEDINIPINVGDEIFMGKFKNKKVKVKEIGKNDKGDLTINDKPALKFRIPIKEEILNERINDIDSDVDYLYDTYFKSSIDLVNSGKKIEHRDFPEKRTDTSVLRSEDCIKAHAMNPCVIKINIGSNYYRPSTSTISLSFNSNAIEFLEDAGGLIGLAIEELFDDNEKITFPLEFTEEKIKGSIHHELLHWIDDTFNNKHIGNILNKASEIGTKDFNGVHFDSSKIEIQGQMGNIKQLYNKFKREGMLGYWNTLTFMQLIKLSPTLLGVYKKLNYDVRNKWVRNIMTRMHREGLLGDNMKFIN